MTMSKNAQRLIKLGEAAERDYKAVTTGNCEGNFNPQWVGCTQCGIYNICKTKNG